MLRFLLRTAMGIFFLTAGFYSFAQQKAEMADVMRSNGKIYVVVAVCITILAGLFIYLVFLDRKISRLEKKEWR